MEDLRDDPELDFTELETSVCECHEWGCTAGWNGDAGCEGLSLPEAVLVMAIALRQGVRVSGLVEGSESRRVDDEEARVLAAMAEDYRADGFDRGVQDALDELSVYEAKVVEELAAVASRDVEVEVPMSLMDVLGASSARKGLCCADAGRDAPGPLRSRIVVEGVVEVELVMGHGASVLVVGPVRVLLEREGRAGTPA